jgi:hypothetical protein
MAQNDGHFLSSKRALKGGETFGDPGSELLVLLFLHFGYAPRENPVSQRMLPIFKSCLP